MERFPTLDLDLFSDDAIAMPMRVFAEAQM